VDDRNNELNILQIEAAKKDRNNSILPSQIEDGFKNPSKRFWRKYVMHMYSNGIVIGWQHIRKMTEGKRQELT